MATSKSRGRKNSPLYLPGAFELFTPSNNIILKNIWIFGPLYAVPLIFSIHAWIWAPLPNQPTRWWQSTGDFSWGWVGSPAPNYLTFSFIGFSLLWLLIIMVAGTIVQIMSQAAQLEGAEGKDPMFDRLWVVVKEVGWRMVGLYIMMGLIIVIGLILLIVPGLIMLRRYLLAPYVMLDRRTGIRDSLDQSAELSKLNTGSIWGILGVMLLISLCGIVPIIGGLASFVLGALYSVAPALRYRQLKKLA